jgi:hypothetical protein
MKRINTDTNLRTILICLYEYGKVNIERFGYERKIVGFATLGE